MKMSGMQSPLKSMNELECGEEISSSSDGFWQVVSSSCGITKSLLNPAVN